MKDAGELASVLLVAHFWDLGESVREDIAVVGASESGGAPPQVVVSEVLALLWA